MKIYTRTGDTGETSLIGGPRVRKDDARIEAYGTVDELNSAIGLARSFWESSPIDAELHQIQRDLFDLGAWLATPADDERFSGVGEERSAALEASIDVMESELAPLKNFILPGGTHAAAHLHVARTVCRRAERLVISLERKGPAAERALKYLNRLSDYLFVAARFANHRQGVEDVPWVR